MSDTTFDRHRKRRRAEKARKTGVLKLSKTFSKAIAEKDEKYQDSINDHIHL
jgi:hypothetical protein